MSRSTISTFKLFEMFPDEETARQYLESRLWPNGVTCPECRNCQHTVFMFCETGKFLFDEMDAHALPGPLSSLEDGSFSDERTAKILDECDNTVTLTEITDELLGRYK